MDAENLRIVLESDPKKMLFSYTTTDDKYGMLFDDVDQNRESFWEGHDQRAYDKLMKIIGDNNIAEEISS